MHHGSGVANEIRKAEHLFQHTGVTKNSSAEDAFGFLYAQYATSHAMAYAVCYTYPVCSVDFCAELSFRKGREVDPHGFNSWLGASAASVQRN